MRCFLRAEAIYLFSRPILLRGYNNPEFRFLLSGDIVEVIESNSIGKIARVAEHKMLYYILDA